MKETKEVLFLGLTMLNGFGKAADDGKFTPLDIAHFYPVLGAVAPAVDNIVAVPAELKNSNPADWDDLVAYAVREFDIPQDAVERKIEIGLEAGLALVRAWQKWNAA